MNIENEITRLTALIKEIETHSAQNPRQKIYIRRHKQYYSLYLGAEKNQNPGNPKEKYVSVKSSDVEKYVNIKYRSLLLPVLKSELGALQNFKKHYKPDEKYLVFEKFPEPFRKMLDSPVKPPGVINREWAEENYCRNPYPFDDEHCFITGLGDRVRSKAEYIIANMLDEMGLLYRCEAEFRLGSRIVYPDFTIVHPKTGELYYLEYFGMMDNEEYLTSSLRKISAYRQTDMAARFIYIFESASSPMNTRAIRNLLMKTFFTGSEDISL